MLLSAALRRIFWSKSHSIDVKETSAPSSAVFFCSQLSATLIQVQISICISNYYIYVTCRACVRYRQRPLGDIARR